MRPTAGIRAFLWALAMLVLAAAPGGCRPAATTGPVAGIEIITPQPQALLPFGSIAVEVRVTNFNLVDKIGQARVPGEGHIVYYLDVGAATRPGKKAVPVGGLWLESTATTYLFDGVWQGSHTVSVELVNNDGTVLNPPAVARVTVLVME